MPNHSAVPDPASLPPAGPPPASLPPAGPPPADPPPAGQPPAGADGALVPRHRRLRLVLAMVGGILALLCLGGVGVVVALYDHATEIKRTEPDVVVDSFLRAYLVDRDDTQAALYECKSGADFAQLAALRDELVNRERSFNVTVTVSWSSLAVAEAGANRRTVDTGLVISGSSNGDVRSGRTEQWRFSVVDADGWRVCAAAKSS